MSSRLQQALEALYGLERRRDKHDLQGITALLAALGNPHQRFRSVHVAGTNGKGSVCALVERVLREAGHTTGLFTSPHLVDFRERIRVGGRWADEAWLERSLDRIAALPEGKDRTFFEVCTALGFEYFAEQQVEIAVVEVGLGGRLDCTNVLTPEVSVITSIGFDHTEILGETLELIAAEKAGIIKPGVPVVSGLRGGTAARVIEEVARRQGAPLVLMELNQAEEWEVPQGAAGIGAPAGLPDAEALQAAMAAYRAYLDDSPWGPRVELPRTHVQSSLALNQDVALTTLIELVKRGWEIPWEAVRRGLAQARWPGRFEHCPDEPRLWWDGAHNVSGMMRLKPQWQGPPPAALVFAVSTDKDLPGMFQVLRWDFAGARVFATRSKSERAATPATIAGHARAAGFDATECDGVPQAVREALAFAGERPILLTGSLFAVGEAMEAFGGAPGEVL